MHPWLGRFSGEESTEKEGRIPAGDSLSEHVAPEKQRAEDDWERWWVDLGGEA